MMRKHGVSDLGRILSVFALVFCLFSAAFAPAAFAEDSALPFNLAAVINNRGDLGAMEAVSCWDNLVSVSVSSGSSGNFVLGLRNDGTVLAAGNNDRGQCNVEDWTDIVKVAAGNGFSVGLKSDGSVVHAGLPDYDLSHLDSWQNIKDIAVGSCFVLGVTDSGEQLFAGCGEFDINLWFQADTANKVWEDKEDEIRFWNQLYGVRAAGENIIGMDFSGELRYFGFTSVRDLPEFEKNIADFAVSLNNGAVLFCDGSALVWGDNSAGQCPSFELNGISQLSLGAEHSVFLTDDGRVFACGSDEFGQAEVALWENVVSVVAGDTCTLGITEDGKLLVAGVLR